MNGALDLLLKFQELEHVNRYHKFSTVKQQSVAAHTCMVVFITMLIVDDIEDFPCSGEVALRRALMHDFGETFTGDFIGDVKTGEFENAALKLERTLLGKFFAEHPSLDTAYQALSIASYPAVDDIVKFADRYDLFLFCRRESILGNEWARRLIDRIYKGLREIYDASETLGKSKVAKDLLAYCRDERLAREVVNGEAETV